MPCIKMEVVGLTLGTSSNQSALNISCQPTSQMNSVGISSHQYYLRDEFSRVRGSDQGARDRTDGHKNREIPHEFNCRCRHGNEMNFLKGLKVPDSDRGMETSFLGNSMP
jgi:hypothetical protein